MMSETNPQVRMSRLNLFLADFRDAQKFARYIIRRKLHFVKDGRAVAKLVHLAFDTSMIVAYSRSFHKSIDRVENGKKVRVVLDEAIVNAILTTKHEQELHHRVIDLRDRSFAHSDSSAREIEGFNYEGDTVLFYKAPIEVITREETRQLSRLIEKWITHLEQQRSEMKAAKALCSRSS